MVKKKRGFRIEKKSLQIIISLTILIIGIFAVYALVDLNKPYHSADEIFVTIGNTETFTVLYFDMTLQDAMDENFLIIGASMPIRDYVKEIPDPGHSARDILIIVDGYTMTLQEAIKEKFLTGENTPSEDIYTKEISGSGHVFATLDQILFDDGTTLQEAIDAGEFCADNSCGGNCGNCEEGYDCNAEGVCVISCILLKFV